MLSFSFDEDEVMCILYSYLVILQFNQTFSFPSLSFFLFTTTITHFLLYTATHRLIFYHFAICHYSSIRSLLRLLPYSSCHSLALYYQCMHRFSSICFIFIHDLHSYCSRLPFIDQDPHSLGISFLQKLNIYSCYSSTRRGFSSIFLSFALYTTLLTAALDPYLTRSNLLYKPQWIGTKLNQSCSPGRVPVSICLLLSDAC